MHENDRDATGHEALRTILRVVGPALLATGVVLLAVGFISFFSSFGSFGGPPRYFWCAFVGIPLIGIGAGISQFAYMGSIFRFITRETTPIQRDVFNELARGTAPGVRDITRAMGRGFTEGAAMGRGHAVEANCPSCATANPKGARYCNHCGAAITDI